MRTMWRIRAAMANQEYDLPNWVWNTSYRCYYPPDRDSYLPYRGWSIDSHTKFSKSQFLMMISPISSDLSLSCAQLYHHEVKSSLSISPCHNHELTPSTPSTASSQDQQSPAPSQSLISRRMLYSTLYIPTITS